jgi:hypothetical protein
MLVAQYLLMGIRSKSSNVASQKSKKKALAAKVVCKYEMCHTKTQTQICIFEAQIYSFLFQPFVKSLRKHPKSLENPAFCAVSCKTVISDKW